MANKKSNGKFFTTILIGGAVGSLVAWLFGNKKRRDVITEKAQEYYETTKVKIDDVLKKPEKSQSFWSRLFGRKDS